MFNAMHDQPADLRRVLAEELNAAKEAAMLLENAGRVLVAGMGTSYCAAIAAAWMLREAGADAWHLNSYDLATYGANFRMRSDDVIVVLSHSGLKKFSKVLLDTGKSAGARVIAVTGRDATVEDVDVVLHTTAKETSSSYTSSHTSAMMAVALIAAELGMRRNPSRFTGFADQLKRIPDQVGEMLSRLDDVRMIGLRAAGRQTYAVGAGPNEATAVELVIKSREAAFARVDGLSLEQYLHGPVAGLNAGDGIVLVNVPGASSARCDNAAQVFTTIGADIWIVGTPIKTAPDAAVFPVPETDEIISPILTVIPIQMLAYSISLASGTNPDLARRDVPKYKKALSELQA